MKTPLAFAFIFSASCLCMNYLPAQGVPTPQASGPQDEEVVQLDTYNVVSGEDTGYTAVDTITGARTATLLEDLPFPVTVVMSEFMEDFALFDLGDQLGYTTSSFTPDDGAGEGYYSLRGFGQVTQLKNGFRRGGLIDRVNVSRLEVIKGPSAAMYGQTEPGGMVNVITYKPKAKPELYLGLTAGVYETQRVAVRATGPIYRGRAGELCYLISGASHQREYEQLYRTYDQNAGAAILSYKFPNNKTIVNVEYSQVKQTRRGASTIPYLVKGNSDADRAIRVGYADELFRFSTQGPDSFVTRENRSIEGSVEHRISKVWHLRMAGHYADRDYWRLRHTGDRFEPGARTILFRQADWHVLYQISKDAQIDLNGLWRKSGLEHRALITFDYNYLSGFSATWRVPTGANVMPATQRNLSVDDPDYGLPPVSSGLYVFQPQLDYIRKTSVYGTLARYQITAMQGRLVGIVGARFDYIKFKGYSHRGVKEPEPAGRAISPQVGINYKLDPQHTLFANYSRSFKPFNPGSTTADGDVEDDEEAGAFDNETGIGYEAGIRSLFFDDRLRVTTNIYAIEKRGMKTQDVEFLGYTVELDEDGNPNQGKPRYKRTPATKGIIKSEGIEIDFSYKLGKQLEMKGVWGYANPRYVDAGHDLDLLGRLPQKVSNMNAAVLGKYTFTAGQLRGLGFTFGVRYTGYTYATTSGGITPPAVDEEILDPYVTSNDGRRDIRTPAYTICDLGATYMWRMGKFRHRVQVNVKNVLDEKYINTSIYAGDRLAVYATYILRY